MTIDNKLIEILACPKCKGRVVLEDGKRIACHSCDLIYPIRDGIPVMLLEEAVSHEE